jgi:hypothetical protein
MNDDDDLGVCEAIANALAIEGALILFALAMFVTFWR